MTKLHRTSSRLSNGSDSDMVPGSVPGPIFLFLLRVAHR